MKMENMNEWMNLWMKWGNSWLHQQQQQKTKTISKKKKWNGIGKNHIIYERDKIEEGGNFFLFCLFENNLYNE